MNANSNDIIKDALAVRDDGASPRFEAHEYEQVLLILARGDEGLAEDGIAHALARIAAGTNDDANALIFASGRKRDAEAAATVGKSAPLDAILSEADRVLSKGAPPTVTRAAAEQAMLDLAKAEARDGEGVCNAYARLCEEDARMQKLYALGQAAEAVEDERAEQLSKRATRNERVWELMVKGARHNRLSGESVEAALERLMKTDKTYADAYALYCE